MRILLPLLALTACGASGDTNTATRSFPVPGKFDAVTLGGPDDVRVVTGSAASITATGRNVELDKITVELRGTELVVTRKESSSVMGWNWGRGDRGVTITVTTPAPIGAATLRGSGDLNVDRGGGANFQAMLRGSGDLTVVNVDSPGAMLSLAGSGDLEIGGRTRNVTVDLAGSGGVDAGGLLAETADINLRGSGDVDVRATRSAKVVLKGSGDVTLSGTANCTSDKRGSGEVTCRP